MNYFVQNNSKKYKILISHHPISELSEWASQELNTILSKHFSLCLTGHYHDQFIQHSILCDSKYIHASAPPLFTSKKENLGYSIINITPSNSLTECISYRQWTKHYKFLPGVFFSGTEDGIIRFQKINCTKNNTQTEEDLVDIYLTSKLQEALAVYSSQPKVWIDPVLSTHAETEGLPTPENQVMPLDLVNNPKSTIIKAPPQFGLTCLARYLAQQAWLKSPKARWVYLDTRALKPNHNSIQKAISSELANTGHSQDDLKGIVLDSFSDTDKNSRRILKLLCELNSNVSIFVMHTLDSRTILNEDINEVVGASFIPLFLCGLSREKIRAFVTKYNVEHYIGEEDAVIARVVSDIDTLNIHRTVLNCITVLKASEVDFNESPVNRTDVLRRILFILFNIDIVPTYKTRPDMQDCEYALGYFCEILIRSEQYLFTKEVFVAELSKFCQERLIDLDVNLLFDILYSSHIFIKLSDKFCFRFTYWIYYFVAQRMHHDKTFSDYVLSEMRYARFPEIIEFYTGIDRRRDDAIKIIIEDLQRGVDILQSKCGLPKDFNLYPALQWTPSDTEVEHMQTEIIEGIQSSNLPDLIKDRYADRNYDPSKPYDQAVREILSNDSLYSVMLTISAACRALRNSDYVDPGNKKVLLNEIVNAWRQITQILWIVIPLLSEYGHAVFDGTGFVLQGDFGSNQSERFRNILIQIPENVVSWYKDDLFSAKMAPLLTQKYKNNDFGIEKHEIVILMIKNKPNGWNDCVHDYINNIHKNSFYIYDVWRRLRHEYMYCFASKEELGMIEYLIKMIAVKHAHGVKKPGSSIIKQTSDSVLPKRLN